MANGLGRGLDSLIPQKVKKVAVNTAGDAIIDVSTGDDKDRVLKVNPSQIIVNPQQPRKNFSDRELEELGESIREYGIIQPLIVTRQNNNYQLIAGERRWRAAIKLNLKEVPVIVRDANEQEQLELALIENIQRQNLNPIETALAYRKLIDEFNLTQEELAKKVSKARPSVANTLRLINLPDEIQLGLMHGKISEGHAKIIMGVEGEERQMALYRKILQSGISVSDTIQETRRLGGTKQARIKINYADKDKEFAFREFFGARTDVKRKGKGGEVILYFYSDDELGEMVKKIKKY
jgi:ParB family transcriptional regulator, chromosome partitioning protein